jgi:hypothetical protein
MLQFLQYKIFGRHRVPDGWIVVTAGNPPEYNNSVREFDIVTWDRLKRIDVEPYYDVWKEYAYKKGVHAAIVTYLDIKKSDFYKIETTVDGKRFVTARGWSDLSDMMHLYEEHGLTVDEALIAQYLQNKKISKDFAFERIDVTASTGDVTVQASATDTIRVKTDTGSIRVEKLSAKALDLAVSTGKVTLSQITCEGGVSIKVSTGKTDLNDVTCQSLTSSGSTGSLSLHHVIATEAFTIRRSTGDVRFDHCDAATISVKTDTGDVSGTLLTAKRFVTETSTGSVRVPQSDSGGKCEIHTTTGDITITIP